VTIELSRRDRGTRWDVLAWHKLDGVALKKGPTGFPVVYDATREHDMWNGGWSKSAQGCSRRYGHLALMKQSPVARLLNKRCGVSRHVSTTTKVTSWRAFGIYYRARRDGRLGRYTVHVWISRRAVWPTCCGRRSRSMR